MEDLLESVSVAARFGLDGADARGFIKLVVQYAMVSSRWSVKNLLKLLVQNPPHGLMKKAWFPGSHFSTSAGRSLRTMDPSMQDENSMGIFDVFYMSWRFPAAIVCEMGDLFHVLAEAMIRLDTYDNQVVPLMLFQQEMLMSHNRVLVVGMAEPPKAPKRAKVPSATPLLRPSVKKARADGPATGSLAPGGPPTSDSPAPGGPSTPAFDGPAVSRSPAPVGPVFFEPARVSSLEPVRVSSLEPARVSSLEPVRVSSLEPARVSSLEPARVSSLEPARAISSEPARVINTEAALEPARAISSETVGAEAPHTPLRQATAALPPAWSTPTEQRSSLKAPVTPLKLPTAPEPPRSLSFLSRHLTFASPGTGLRREVESEGTLRVGVQPALRDPPAAEPSSNFFGAAEPSSNFFGAAGPYSKLFGAAEPSSNFFGAPPSKYPYPCAASSGSGLSRVDPSSGWPTSSDWLSSLEANLPMYCPQTAEDIERIFRSDL